MGRSRDMSQSAIVESGSNANGEYVKWDDGTMICTHQVSVTAINVANGSGFQSNPAGTWTYPQSFTGSVAVSGSSTASTLTSINMVGSGNFSSTFRGIRFTSAASASTANVMAIGRWR